MPSQWQHMQSEFQYVTYRLCFSVASKECRCEFNWLSLLLFSWTIIFDVFLKKFLNCMVGQSVQMQLQAYHRITNNQVQLKVRVNYKTLILLITMDTEVLFCLCPLTGNISLLLCTRACFFFLADINTVILTADPKSPIFLLLLHSLTAILTHCYCILTWNIMNIQNKSLHI